MFWIPYDLILLAFLSNEFSFKVKTLKSIHHINIIHEVFKRKVETSTFAACKTNEDLSTNRKEEKYKKVHSFLSTVSKERRGKTQISGGGWLPQFYIQLVYRATLPFTITSKNLKCSLFSTKKWI